MSKKVIEPVTISQNEYPNLNFDYAENDVIHIWQRGKQDYNRLFVQLDNRTTVAKAIDPEYQKVEDERDGLQSDLCGWENRAKEAEQRNAKLVEASNSLLIAMKDKKLAMDIPSDEKIYMAYHNLREALQNTKNIEG